MSIDEKVCAVIERETGENVTPETLIESLDVDSLEFVDLLLALSNETGKEIDDAHMGSLITVADIIRELR